MQLYGTGIIKPNHHYATHVVECVRNFGPLHDFWTFLYERLNKVLKSFKTNNHGQGELETTFFTEFQKTCQTSCLVGTMHLILRAFLKQSRCMACYAIQRNHFHTTQRRLCSGPRTRSAVQ